MRMTRSCLLRKKLRIRSKKRMIVKVVMAARVKAKFN